MYVQYYFIDNNIVFFAILQFQSFFSTSENVGSSRGVQQGYEYIKANIYWFENVYSSLVTWLNNREDNL